MIKVDIKLIEQRMNPVLRFLFGMSWRTTLTGYISAVGIAMLGVIVADGVPDLTDSTKRGIFWSALVTAAFSAIRSRFTQDQLGGDLKHEGVIGEIAEKEIQLIAEKTAVKTAEKTAEDTIATVTNIAKISTTKK